MQTDYMEEAKKRQEEESRAYQRTRDPFEYGKQVSQRRYSEIMAGLDAQKADVNRSYGSLYQAAKDRAVGTRAAGMPTLSGGMGQQQRDYLSSMEMRDLSSIGGAQNQALRDLETQAQSAFANAELEGMQAEQIRLQSQQTKLQLVQQKQAIMADDSLTQEQKDAQLKALGYDPQTVAPEIPAGVSPAFGAVGGILGAVTIGAGLIKGKGALGMLGAAAKFALPVAGWAGVIALATLGVDKAIEWLAPDFNDGKGLFNLSDLGI